MTRRERIHDNVREEVKAIARQHMAAQGTAAISLRAIARDMELSAPALYRYFPSRDDLLTALIVDAFNSQGEAMRQAVANSPAEQPLAQVAAFMLAYRTWALANPVDFQLIYGNPIPDYHAPIDITTPAARNAMSPGVMALQDALQSGALIPPAEYDHMPAEIRASIEAQISGYGNTISPMALYLAMIAWGHGHGLVMLELFGHLAPTVGNPAIFYTDQVQRLIRQMGGQFNDTG